jgi:hypothetical protein
MTHADLVKRAERWLRGTQRCSVVVSEMASYSYERPDAIGWTSGRSILVECKMSRSDFAKDLKKHFRQDPRYGMGDFRFYMVPPGLLTAKEIPDRWGLLEARPKQVRVIVEALAFDRARAAFMERPLLFSALRRLMEDRSME